MTGDPNDGLGWLGLVVVCLLAVVLVGAWFQVADYQVQRHWLEVRFRGWVVIRYDFKDIAGVSVGGTFPAVFWPVRWFLGSHRLVTVHLRRGWIRNVVLTPEDPERFCRDFRFSLGRLPTPGDDAAQGG